METMGMEQLVTNFFLLFNLVNATRMAGISTEIAVEFRGGRLQNERTIIVFSRRFAYRQQRSPCKRRCVLTVHRTARIIYVPHTQFFSCAFGAQLWTGSLRSLLDPQSSPHFSAPFLALALGSSTTPSLLCPSASPSTATLQGRLCFGRLAEQFPLTGYEPKSLIEASSEYTPIDLPSRKGSPDTNLDDLATTVDASETHDKTDVGGWLPGIPATGVSWKSNTTVKIALFSTCLH